MCHLVIARIAPEARVVDVVHGIDGLRAGSAILAQALPFSPRAVHLAVVDPGVGTERRAVVLVTGGGSLLVGPDNGLLVRATEVLGGVVRAHELAASRLRLEPVSQTFHGRDIFAPAAAHLALGVAPEEFGPPVDPQALVRLPPALVEAKAGRLTSEVVRFDHYGNVQLAASAADLKGAALGAEAVVEAPDGMGVAAVVGRRFADAEPGQLVVYVDSGGSVAVACYQGSARAVLGDPGQLTISRKA